MHRYKTLRFMSFVFIYIYHDEEVMNIIFKISEVAGNSYQLKRTDAQGLCEKIICLTGKQSFIATSIDASCLN